MLLMCQRCGCKRAFARVINGNYRVQLLQPVHENWNRHAIGDVGIIAIVEELKRTCVRMRIKWWLHKHACSMRQALSSDIFFVFNFPSP
jgi:hypothetical protein